MKNENFEKKKKRWSGDMVERELSTKFGLVLAAVSEKLEFTDGRTTDASAMTVALLTKSSRAKIQF